MSETSGIPREMPWAESLRIMDAAIADGDRVARLHEEARDVDDAAVDAEVAVRHELTRLRAAHRGVHAVHDVVETALEQLQERLTGLPRHGCRGAEVVLELRFEDAVIAAHLLFLTQLASVFGDLLTARFALSLLAGRGAAALDRALFGQAAVALEEQLDLLAGLARRGFPAAQAAHGFGVTGHLTL